MTAEDLANARYHAVGTILSCQDAIALRNGKYFRLGTRRVFEELGAMENVPANLQELVDSIVALPCCGLWKNFSFSPSPSPRYIPAPARK